MSSTTGYQRVKNFQITNWSCNTPEVYKKYKDFIQYIAWGEEKTKCGILHHQTFLMLKKPTTHSEKCLRRIADWFGNAHVEVCKGSIKQNVDYVSKEGTLNELGIAPQQGQRTDLTILFNDVKNGIKTTEDILDEHPLLFHRYERTFKAIEKKAARSLQSKNLKVRRKGIWYYGLT